MHATNKVAGARRTAAGAHVALTPTNATPRGSADSKTSILCQTLSENNGPNMCDWISIRRAHLD